MMLSLASCFLLIAGVCAFRSGAPLRPLVNTRQLKMVDSTDMGRNEFGRFTAGAAKFLAASCLLPSMLSGSVMPLVSSAHAAQYLTEPTSEFKDQEKQVAEFKAKQRKIRSDWDKITTAFVKSESSADLEKYMLEMTSFLKGLNDGVPTGVKKKDLVKLCRSKKYDEGSTTRKPMLKAAWTKNVEIAYDNLILEFNRQMSPKSMGET